MLISAPVKKAQCYVTKSFKYVTFRLLSLGPSFSPVAYTRFIFCILSILQSQAKKRKLFNKRKKNVKATHDKTMPGNGVFLHKTRYHFLFLTYFAYIMCSNLFSFHCVFLFIFFVFFSLDFCFFSLFFILFVIYFLFFLVSISFLFLFFSFSLFFFTLFCRFFIVFPLCFFHKSLKVVAEGFQSFTGFQVFILFLKAVIYCFSLAFTGFQFFLYF